MQCDADAKLADIFFLIFDIEVPWYHPFCGTGYAKLSHMPLENLSLSLNKRYLCIDMYHTFKILRNPMLLLLNIYFSQQNMYIADIIGIRSNTRLSM